MHTSNDFTTRVVHFHIPLYKVSNTLYFLFPKEILTSDLLHCTLEFSHLSLNLVLVMQNAEF